MERRDLCLGACWRRPSSRPLGVKVNNKLPSVEYLSRVLEYNPESGDLTWLPRLRDEFDSQRAFSTWNSRYAGKPAGTMNNSGYLVVMMRPFGRFRAHRIAWKIINGTEPDQIDHANGVRNDNRIVNLSAATAGTNRKNSGPKVGRSMPMGVDIRSDGMIRVRVGKATKYAKSIDQAVSMAKMMREQMGYHPNHGRGL